jgi:4-hydroxy-tetrahydrodipicolinate synthase
MSRYGIDYYGLGYYGPDNLSTYSAAPATSISTQYGSIQLDWVNPSGNWSKLRLVRNSYGFPTSPYDGISLVDVYQGNDPTTFIDSVDIKEGAFYYYSVFVYQVVSYTWVRSANIIGTSVKNFGNGNKMFEYLPEIYKTASLYSVDGNENQQLKSFLNLFGFQLDYAQTITELLIDRYDVQKVNGNLIPLLLNQFGLDYEPEIGLQQSRILVRDAIQLYKASEEAGADGVMIVTPYYNKPTQAGVLTHFRMIADATDLPVILYDIPGRTGIPIQFETILRAAKHPNIVAIKDAKGDFAQVSRVLNETDLIYFSGDDSNVLPHISLGATGLIGVTANIAPKAYRDLVDATNRNDFNAALDVHMTLEPLVRATMTHVPGTVAAKYILDGLGLISSPRVRLPLVGPEESEAAKIEADIDKVGKVSGLDFTNFRPDRNAAAGGALPKVAGTTR